MELLLLLEGVSAAHEMLRSRGAEPRPELGVEPRPGLSSDSHDIFSLWRLRAASCCFMRGSPMSIAAPIWPVD